MIPVYFCIEETNRELDSRIITSVLLCNHLVETYIASQWAIWENLEYLPTGVIFFKGNNEIQAHHMERAKKFGHLIASIEEEVFGICDKREIERVYTEKSIGLLDRIFVQSKYVADTLSSVYAVDPSKLVTSGNPRSDLLSPPLSNPVMKSAGLIREKLPDFILINTNYSSINPRVGDTINYFDLCVGAKIIDPGNSEDVKDFFAWSSWERDNLKETISIIDRLNSDATNYLTIVRPHPSENQIFWQDVIDHYENVSIVSDSEHLPWLAAANAVIHTSCTTGLEAKLLGARVVNLAPGTSSWHDKFIVNQLGTTYDDCESAVGAVLNEEAEKESGIFSDRKSFYLNIRGSQLASEKIAQSLTELSNTIPATPKPIPSHIRERKSGASNKIHSEQFNEIQMQTRVNEISRELKMEAAVKVETVSDEFFSFTGMK